MGCRGEGEIDHGKLYDASDRRRTKRLVSKTGLAGSFRENVFFFSLFLFLVFDRRLTCGRRSLMLKSAGTHFSRRLLAAKCDGEGSVEWHAWVCRVSFQLLPLFTEEATK